MPEARQSPLALVVDDDPTGRAFLRALLRRAGYVVEVAASGEEGIERFTTLAPDVVFMDMMMPGIDGVEATRAIKAQDGSRFVPVIFVTGAGDEQSLVRAIDAGGDDFLVKPVEAPVLLAKLRAMERIRALHQRTRRLYDRVVEDQLQAREVFDRAVSARALDTPALRACLKPAEVFSGDLLLSGRAPDGSLRVLVGDFTGHGLTAALGAMPAADVFRAGVSRGAPVDALLAELNQRMQDALPRGHFLAATLMEIEPSLRRLVLANCGMPEVLVCGSGVGVRERVVSSAFALGIERDFDFSTATTRLEVSPGDRVVVASDGVYEAQDAAGEAFGAARLDAVLADASRPAPPAVVAALDSFRGAVPLADDASVVEVLLDATLFDASHGAAMESVMEEAA
jgi:CheY-like chemotaxis protein